ncbi:MAG: protease modulator HflC [Fuerstiella sp.]|nr:protease modulator HflC [Fuerstiella sp.]
MAANNSIKGPVAVLIAILMLTVTYSSIFTVNERELAVLLEFGKPVSNITEPGLYYKIPLIQEVRRFPRTRQFWASGRNDVLVDLPTKDGKKIEIAIWAIWRITDPEKFLRVMRTVGNAEQQVRQRVRAGVRDVITSYDLAEVVRSSDRELTYSFGLEDLPETESDALNPVEDLAKVGEQADILFGRQKIMGEIRQRIKSQLAAGDEDNDGATLDRGIELVDVGVSNIGFVQSVRQASFERLTAFMEAIAAKYHNEGEQRKQEIINETNALAEEILGEGEEQNKRLRGEVEAEIIELYAEAIRKTDDFYNFQRTLEVYETALDASTRLILTTDSDLFRMLKQVSPAQPEHETSDDSSR